MGRLKDEGKGFDKKEEKWPKYIPEHTEGKCPYCKKQVKNIEAHVKDKHLSEKPRQIIGIKHQSNQPL